jgi:hypothetical protein
MGNLNMGNLNRRRAIGAARAAVATMAVVCRGPPAKGSPPAAFLRALCLPRSPSVE